MRNKGPRRLEQEKIIAHHESGKGITSAKRNHGVSNAHDGNPAPLPGDRLDPERILETLEGGLFSSRLVYRETVDSTNRVAKELGRQGAPEGTLVLAEQQTAGRGRRGRSWLSPGHVNLLLSLLLRPPILPERAFVLTMILALATSDGVHEVSGLRPLIKWPNDLYVNGRKLAGILTEFSVVENRVEYMVLGMGLNVNWDPGEHPTILYPATSLFRETGRRIPREGLLLRILKRFEETYRVLLTGEIMPFYRKWNELSMVLGKEVELDSGKERLRGTALRINQKGALILRDVSGREREILHGDVSLKTL